MNIEFQCCGLVLLATVFIMNSITGRRRFILYSSKLFVAALAVAIITTCLDIASMVALYYVDANPVWATELVCKVYIIGLVFEATACLIYAMYDCFSYERYRRFAYIYLAIDILASVVISILPISFNVTDPSHAFTEGPSVLATYGFCCIVLSTTVFLLFRYRKRMNTHRHRGVFLWVACWFVAAGIQFFYNRLLLIGFATAIGMTILFAILENPVAGIDRVSGVFSLSMLHEYMNQQYNRKRRFSMISFSFAMQSGLFEAEDDLRLSLVNFFDSFAGAIVFRNTRSGFVLVFDHGQYDMHDIVKKFRNIFAEKWVYGARREKARLLSPTILVMENSDVAQSAARVFALCNYAFNTSVDESGAIIYLDDQLAKAAREFNKRKNELLSAMRQDRVVVFYQPIWSIEKKKFVSAEALVRIRREDGSIIPPGMFIPVAEETGHILELGRIVFEKVCRFISVQEPKKLGIDYIEVNLSVKQCEQRELSAVYRGIIQKYKVNPAYINLEITESSSIEIRQNVIDNMHDLIRFVIDFSLDDFGNGQSNLDYIIDMPVAIVKFDRKMTQAYFSSEKARLVMRTIVKMIHEMHLKIVAEGVEHKHELEELERIGVEYIQGFFFSKPLPEPEFLSFVHKYNFTERFKITEEN
ncbi:MAG: EAL domain-containing protein [Eubacterium sp.]|nr:EAL domain-containing protein [Eubacterium sp.]